MMTTSNRSCPKKEDDLRNCDGATVPYDAVTEQRLWFIARAAGAEMVFQVVVLRGQDKVSHCYLFLKGGQS